MRVFLTTSGLGTRLEGLTKGTNKALVRVGDRYAICRIIEKFPNDTEFVITLGYYGNHVRDFLELAYPDRQFIFVEVDRYEGPGSSQAYSMLAAASHLTQPFLYHCCDTLLPTDQLIQIPETGCGITLFVSPHEDYTTYSGITVRDRRIVRFNKKREAIHDFAYIGISYIHDPTSFWNALRQAVDSDPMNSSLGDTTAYTALLGQGCPMDYKIIPNFYDTGNLESYRAACTAFPAKHIVLEKPNESLCFLHDRVIKFIQSAKTNALRTKRGQLLELVGGPKLLGSRDNFLAMELVEGEVLAECREYGEVRRLLDWAYDNLWCLEKTSDDFFACCWRFYHDKTMARIDEYFKKTAEDPTRINGIHVGTIGELMARVPFAELCTNRFSLFHGDFILDNIMRRPNGEFVLLDWRDSFDGSTEWGDRQYDLAKLRHNLVFQHSNIAAGMFSIRRDGEDVFVDLNCKYLLTRQLEELDMWIMKRGWSVGNIRILQALIWINMAPLYDAPLSNFLFAFGKWNLWLALDAFSS
jgi:choline kinase